MKICIEESTYEGTPIEILTQLRTMHFDADTFDGTEGYAPSDETLGAGAPAGTRPEFRGSIRA